MSFLQSALELAAKGFWVFPLISNSKLPAVDDFTNRATRDPERIRAWWVDPVFGWENDLNIGIATSKFGDNEALLVIDVDNKGDKKGDDEIFRLEIEGRDCPPTFEQQTPTGGRHLVYRVEKAVTQGVNVYGRGLDCRSLGGYVCGAGSRIGEKSYTASPRDVARCPEWALSGSSGVSKRAAPESTVPGSVDRTAAQARAAHYLSNEAPLALEGNGGDQLTYQVAARVKDLGLDLVDCTMAMAELWNPRCLPPWSIDELTKKITNAYHYGKERPGSSAPETQFTSVNSNPEREFVAPIVEINKSFALIAGPGARVLHEKIDHKGLPVIEHLSIFDFHTKFSNRFLTVGNGKPQTISEIWMRHAERREYDGIVFMPGLTSPPRFYNLWRGFAVEPAPVLDEGGTTEATAALKNFRNHALQNVCGNDHDLFDWLMGYFAHIVQRPWEKPLTALVLKGKKGVGKNALIDCVGHLLGCHYLLTADRRYITGNFNGHLENLLLFTLDEAFWSGDKQAEGIVKNLITGKKHNIEHKGKEQYNVDNCTRIIILGNEEWIIPASEDERRYAVFNVGTGRKQDTAFFTRMREGMEQGGYAMLLRFLLDFDISRFNFNQAPSTQGLLDQKNASLGVFHQWWLDSLTDGRLLFSEFANGDWPGEIDKDSFRGAFRRYTKDRNIGGRAPDERRLGRDLKEVLPSIDPNQKRRAPDGSRINIYTLPPLPEARKAWETYIGHTMEWS
jgi:bifunctional DNA primase/polymerase-like protein/uncharacterized protein DUF5906